MTKMRKSLLLTSALALSLVTGIMNAQENFSFNFNKYSKGYKNYTEANLKKDFSSSKLLSIVGMKRAKVGNKQIRAFYPKNKILGKDTGFRFERLLKPSKEGVLEYRVKFEKGFDWSKGGKLPGLAGSNTTTGRGVFGCNDNRDTRKKAFSTRLMWREGGRLIYYPYAPLHSSYRNSSNDIPTEAKKRGQGRCGGDLTITTLSVNKWYTIKQYIKLNTFNANGSPKSNGIVKVWINGKLEFEHKNFVLAGTKSVEVNGFAFHTYRGGSTKDWASKKDGYALFDDIKACTGCKNVKGGSTNNGGNTQSVNVAPTISLKKPANNSTYRIGDTIILEATASDSNGNLEKVNFKINGDFYKRILKAPFKTTFKPKRAGTYKIIAKSFDTKGLSREKLVTITVKARRRRPAVAVTSPANGSVYKLGETINLSANATDPDGNLDKVNYNINGKFYKTLARAPYNTNFKPTEAGTYKIIAKSFDADGLTKEELVIITVDEAVLSNNDFSKDTKIAKIKAFPSPAISTLNVVGITNDTPVSIISLNGRIVMREMMSKNKTQIEVSGLAKGLYFLRIENGSNPKRISFIKK